MDRRALLQTTIGGAVCSLAWPGWSQPTERLPKVAWVTAAANHAPRALEAFRAGLRDRGWQEGRNLELILPAGERGDARRVYAEMLAAGVDLIVATGAMGLDVGLLAAEVPVVFAVFGDPVEAGLVKSLAQPQANRTGMTLLAHDLTAKRLELLAQAAPGLRRVGHLHHEAHAGARSALRHAREACDALGLELRPLPLIGAGDVGPALQSVTRHGLQGLVTAVDSVVGAAARQIAEFGIAARLPVVSGWSYYANAGYLFSYGAGVSSFYRGLAAYVDHLLRGAKAAELPVQTPPQVELVVNLKTAAAIGLTLPPALLARADEVIR